MENSEVDELPTESAPAIGSVFQALIKDIAGGKYAPGSRLPAERELARLVGASRPTLREALRRLGEWGVVEAKRGSGVVVREMRHWSLEVLPSFLRHGKFGGEIPGIATFLADMLVMRRTVVVNVMPAVAERTTAEAVAQARESVDHAWNLRSDSPAFAKYDFAIFSNLVEAAKMYPGLWLMNSMGRVYTDLAQTMGAAFGPPDDYVASMNSFLDAMEVKEGSLAQQRLHAYYTRVDERLTRLLELLRA